MPTKAEVSTARGRVREPVYVTDRLNPEPPPDGSPPGPVNPFCPNAAPAGGTPGWPSCPAGGGGAVGAGPLAASLPPRPSRPAIPRIVAGVIVKLAEIFVRNGSNRAVSVPT